MANKQPSLFHFLNINSVRNKLNQVKAVLWKPPKTVFLGLCETKVSSDSKYSLKVSGYDCHNHPHSEESSGILNYVNNKFPNKGIESLNFNRFGSMCTFVDVVLSESFTVRVGTVYIRPNANSDTVKVILDKIGEASRGNRPLLVLGDFNCRSKSLGDTVSSPNSLRLLSCCRKENLTILNEQQAYGVPTRGNSILDLAITNRSSLFWLSVDRVPFVSDHSSLSVMCYLPSVVSPPPPLRWNSVGDWMSYSFECISVFRDLYSELMMCLSYFTEGNKQEKMNEMVQKLTNAFNTVASKHLTKSAPKPLKLHNSKLHSLLIEYGKLHHKRKKLKNKINKWKKEERDVTHLENKLKSTDRTYNGAKVRWEALSKSNTEKEWQKLCASVEGVNRQVAWKRWHRTLPSSNLPLNAVTVSRDDPLPSSINESLNNMAGFYSTVMSPQPIPSWTPRGPEDDDPRDTLYSRHELEEFDEFIRTTVAKNIGNIPSVLDSWKMLLGPASRQKPLPPDLTISSPLFSSMRPPSCIVASSSSSTPHGIGASLLTAGNRPTRFVCSKRGHVRTRPPIASSPSPP